MKKFLLAAVALSAVLGGSATAADLAVNPGYRVPPRVWSWTGFYIGAHVGAGWGTKEWTNNTAPVGILTFAFSSDNSHTVNGILGGGQIGYNWQTGPVVWGVEIQASGADIKGKSLCFAAFVTD